MKRPIRTATLDQAIHLNDAVALLRQARRRLIGANCPKAVAALAAALKSAEGAQRHMQHRLRRTREPSS